MIAHSSSEDEIPAVTTDPKTQPLWQTALKALRDDGIQYGRRVSREWLEHQLNAEFGTIQFGTGISSMNDELIAEGYYLTARDQHQEGYVIATPEQSESICDSMQRDALRRQRRCVQFLGGVIANPEARLSAETKRRLESKQEKAAQRYLLMRRSEQIRRVVQKHAPKLLE